MRALVVEAIYALLDIWSRLGFWGEGEGEEGRGERKNHLQLLSMVLLLLMR